jgi:hypothetical protein
MIDFLQALKQHFTEEIGGEEERRAAICAACPDKEVRAYAQILDSKMVELNGYVCKVCSCPLATKIFAKEDKNICPKWKK